MSRVKETSPFGLGLSDPEMSCDSCLTAFGSSGHRGSPDPRGDWGFFFTFALRAFAPSRLRLFLSLSRDRRKAKGVLALDLIGDRLLIFHRGGFLQVQEMRRGMRREMAGSGLGPKGCGSKGLNAWGGLCRCRTFFFFLLFPRAQAMGLGQSHVRVTHL